jgi:hypothetical protein
MRGIIAVALLLPFLSCALNLQVPAEEEDRVVHRLKAGKDLNRFQEKTEESSEESEEWWLGNPDHTNRKTLRSVAKDAKTTKQRMLKQVQSSNASKLDLLSTYEDAMQVVEDADVKEDASKHKDRYGEFRPRMEIIASEFKVGKDSNVEVFWQRPKGKVKGVMFGATGCFHQAGDFFEQRHKDGWEFTECKDSKLRRCQGLPDNVYFFKYALARDYLVLTITPQGKNSCWEHKNDPKRVDVALRHVLKKEGLPLDLKMYASGASQGGYFMYDMQKAEIPNLKCIAPQCAEMKYQTHKEHLPTMVIYMPKDYNISGKIRNSIAYLNKKIEWQGCSPHSAPMVSA